MTSGITVVIPTHPARMKNGLLDRALHSVWSQTLLPDAVNVAVDTEREGAARTRQRALDAVTTRWTAFLDSDDEFLPQHLQRLVETAEVLGAAFIFSWFHMVGGCHDPLGHFGLPFSPHTPHHTTMTVLCRTDIAQEVGFIPAADGAEVGHEDWRFITGFCKIAIERDLLMTHLAEHTWNYHCHSGNTSGVPYRGDAR